MLQRHFVARFAAQYRKEIRGITHRAQIRLSQHSWPGNVRELENVIGHAAMMAMSDMVDAQDLPPYLQASSEQAEPTAAPRPPVARSRKWSVHISSAFFGRLVAWSAPQLSVSDVPRTTLNALMRRLGISRDDFE